MHRRRFLLVPLIAMLAAAAPGAAQLRPLEPLPAGVLQAKEGVVVQFGGGAFSGQRASLAGTEGTLLEIGNFRAIWRTGRVALEAGGTVLWQFHDREVFAEPSGGARPDAGPRRRDSGDYRVATAVRLTPEAWNAVGFLRFGTRLPTTDNTVGIERDRTDFFALVGAHAAPGGWRLAAESGVGINGTHHPRLEQSDVLVYAASASRRIGRFTPGVLVLGHADGMPGRAIRGNEELAEIRIGSRVGDRLWVEAQWVRGLTDFSPRTGVLLTGGWSG